MKISNKSNIEIAIIIPVYNCNKYITKTLDLLLNQTFKNFIIILVNDCSTDNTLEVISSYKNKNIYIINNSSNQGPGAARNKGLEFALKYFKSNYLLFLDADDMYEQCFLEEMLNSARNNNADILICNSSFYDDLNNANINYENNIRFQYLKKNMISFSPREIADYIFNFCVGWTWDKLFKTELIQKNKIRFQKLLNTDDAYFTYISLIFAKQITINNLKLVIHRINVKNSVSNSRTKNIKCMWQAIKAIYDKLITENLYKIYEIGFINWVLSFSFWYLSTLKETKSKEKLYYLMKNNYFKVLKIDTYSKKKIYVKQCYKLFNLMKKNDFESFNLILNKNSKRKEKIKKFAQKNNALYLFLKNIYHIILRK